MSKWVLHDFSRQIWVSDSARALWEPRIAAIGQHFAAAERASVGGIRSAALQKICPEQFQEMAQRAAKIGLVAIPLNIEGMTESYSASTVARKGSDPWEYRIVLTTPGKASQFIEAWRGGDDETIGSLLGYPQCCRRFFGETWGSGSVDPTWGMADHGDGPAEANILLRWLGVRYVPHMPCGFLCEETVNLGRQFRRLIPENEREWMDELLSMPMLWSSLNGIGEVVTPIVTLNFRSDVNHELIEIRRQGKRWALKGDCCPVEIESYPEAGAYGLRFPYRSPAQRPDEHLWTDNGFTSRKDMEEGHRMILSAIGALGDGGDIIDLGAGNGELLRKLGGDFGIDSDRDRVGRRVWPGVTLGQIQDVEELFSGQRFAVAIISVRRFEELEKDELQKLAGWFTDYVDSVLVYQYDMPIFARMMTRHELELLATDPWRGRCIVSIPAVAK